MARKRQPKPLGIDIGVLHPESAFSEKERGNGFQKVDGDGHYISFHVNPMRGEKLCEITLRRGISHTEAANILRKLADRVERDRGELLNFPRGVCGWLNQDGVEVNEMLSLEYDESGNDLKMPEIE